MMIEINQPPVYLCSIVNLNVENPTVYSNTNPIVSEPTVKLVNAKNVY